MLRTDYESHDSRDTKQNYLIKSIILVSNEILKPKQHIVQTTPRSFHFPSIPQLPPSFQQQNAEQMQANIKTESKPLGI